MNWKGRLFKVVLAVTFVFSSIPALAFASPSDENAVAKGEVVFQSELGNKVVKMNKGTNETYVVVADPLMQNEISDSSMKEAKNAKKEIKGKKVYFEIAANLEQAKQIANSPSPGSSEIAAKGSFWHGSFIEDVYDWYYGNGWHVHLAPVDVSYITNIGWIAADTLVGAAAAAGAIAAAPAVIVAGILTVAVVATSWELQNNDGSVDLTMYKPNLNITSSTCVTPGEWLGQATGLTGFINYYWPSNVSGYCY